MFWPTKKLGEVLEYEQPTEYIVKSTSYRDDYKTPVLTAGKSFILGYTNEKQGIFPKEKLPVIIFDDFTTESKYVDFPFKVKSSAMKILHPRKDLVDPKFIFYRMQTINFTPTQHKRYWISVYSKFEISLPPLSEQKRIVKKIEKLFAKIDEVEKLRKEAIGDTESLLKSTIQEVFERGENEGWQTKKLGEIAKVEWGNTSITKKQYVSSGFLAVSAAGPDGFLPFYDHKGKAIVLSAIGAKCGKCFFVNGKWTAIKNTIVIKPDFNQVDISYLFFFINDEKKWHRSNTAAQPFISQSNARKLKIPLPPLFQQKQIVTYLDSLSEKIRRLKELQNQTAHEISLLRQSILDKAFKGEL